MFLCLLVKIKYRRNSYFGIFASGIKTISLGCKNDALKFVLFIRPQILMCLNSPTLIVLCRCMYVGRSYMLYASTGEMLYLECGNTGHIKMNCTFRSGGQWEGESAVNGATLGSKAEQALRRAVRV